ncbi:MAG: putative manganese transporter [Pseudomonadota bacterium]
MTGRRLAKRTLLGQSVGLNSPIEFRRAAAPILIIAVVVALNLSESPLANVVVDSLLDAYLAVSVFVAATLAVFYAVDRMSGSGATAFIGRAGVLQIPLAALLGALPGCGGAIIVVTQFVSGGVRFGALVAVLIATMGDAAFILLAREPQTALLVYSLSMLVGIVTGHIVDMLHPPDFMRPSRAAPAPSAPSGSDLPRPLVVAFLWCLVPGFVIGVLDLTQVEIESSYWSTLSTWIGCIGAGLCLAIWFSCPLDSWSARLTAQTTCAPLSERVAGETSFVSAWVIIGFLLYAVPEQLLGVDPASMFVTVGAWFPLLMVLVGFVPGCGPQIVVTTLYVNGAIPLSAQLANAISNDGDALFPALALAPRAAIVATGYSAIPAIIVGYLVFGLGY